MKAGPDSEYLPAYFTFMKVLIARQFDPRASVTVEEVNGVHAGESPYRRLLSEEFEASLEPDGLRLRRRY